MNKAILLTGDPGIGKTTLLRDILRDRNLPAGGFYTREVRVEGTRVGFEIVTLDGMVGRLAHIESGSKLRVGRYGVDLEALEQIGVPAIQHAMEDQILVVIDEIGPMEIYSEVFRTVVMRALSADVTLFGTIVKRSVPFADQVKMQPRVKLIEVTVRNRENLPAEISRLFDSN